VGQAVKTRLELWLGEWFLDIDEGTPYMQGVLGKYSKEVADRTIQDRVLKTEGVTQIANYESTIDPDTRNLSVSMDVDTIYGPTTVQLENYRNL
jgi:predicted proteasome-type protease